MRHKRIDQSLAQFKTSTEENQEWGYSRARDMAILGFWDEYTLSAQRLCERMATETQIWSADLHGDHCLFVNIGEHHPERHTSIEAYIYDTQVIDEGFFLQYLNTSPKAKAYTPSFSKNGYATMCELLDRYVREGILERRPYGFKRTDT
ncbi:hypothetical protein [Paenibacillus polymyxa]|uniref:hypothetical protein n=1 Tax=Paenibacillus polymyxa TaxID=1406 RepID=UPI00035C61B1|nr:hypothetical protein [Paenibacillus polymyxa]NMP07880.1 hypothetical protein [Paenibacillus polymyxa]